ncbi:hypothetical protein [Haloarchaeobius sp. HME9146]|uniref:hypothetical protein n=1 Tax=Haloarchaeobius sp. HME9146 TaxID=2978732 RepID=UPI0021BFDD78|nr:hypothetical protein [Haloarchaeobius sp. HME9146]MCT9097478.1 hypothetical protein [Haloarchaeobius sp. HME9146]
MLELPGLVPMQLGVETIGGIVLLIIALVVVYKVINLAFSIAIKVLVIAIAALVVLWGLSLVGFNPLGLPFPGSIAVPAETVLLG